MPVLSLPKILSTPHKQTWSNLQGAAWSLAIAQSAATSQSLTLVLTADSQSAERLQEALGFFAPNIPTLLFPDWETLPYDLFSPHQDIISQRIAALYRLPELTRGVLIVPINTALHRLPPSDFVLGSSLLLDVGDTLDIDALRNRLQAFGYRCVDSVYEHGEFAIRGALIDLFPMGSALPFRIDLLDQSIETLRTFNPETQRSIEKVSSIRLLPAREFPLDKAAVSYFRGRFRERFEVDVRRCSIYQDLSSGITPAGIEYYVPLFFAEMATLFDYLPQNTQIFCADAIEAAAEHFWQDARTRYQERAGDLERPILNPLELFLPVDRCFAALNQWPRITLSSAALAAGSGHTHFPTYSTPDISIQAKSSQPLSALEGFIVDYSGRILLCAESAGRREVLLDLLADLKPERVTSWEEFIKSSHKLALCIAPLEEGLHLDSVAVITERALLGQRVAQRRRREKTRDSSEHLIKNLAELREGAPVVHIDHGVGRYLGLVTLAVDQQQAEFLALQYADEATLYVPVAHLHLIARYSGADEALAPLHRLGSETWQKAKQKAAEQVRDVAAELLDIYAQRALRVGHAFQDPELDYAAFCAGFPFEETPDQQAAIHAVRADLLAGKPMDRLICGDVGFGKTEVALRAAFIVAHNARQVAVLVPTTLLAEQHYHSFRDRFADWPIRVEVMSRFKSAKEINHAIAALANGQIDILIGTHKLLQDDVQFKKLGLLIIDEEHRFGVRQKERLKALRAEVDVLTLTATPIPRTLNMAVAGMRDLSIIATPPAKRLSVRTFVAEHNKALIKEALLRELLRGGQVYYLHNEVKSIEQCAAELAELVPEARIAVGHGQMRERDLERVMSDFYHKRFNVLVASTIIETGIDVPSANTIVIARADKFGLAQLHQLRGRVGRSHHQAYAYLLTPARKQMTDDAIKRLEAISNAQDLGAGFVLATHDLEIRGAGELLGEGQSGQIHSIGFSLYMEMLERTVAALKSGTTLDLNQPLHSGPEINLRLPALLPEDYVPDVHERLMLYKRIASARDEQELRDLQVELIDRFGLLPEATQHLMHITALKLYAEPLGIRRLEAGPQGGRIEFATNTRVEPLRLVSLIQKQPQHYQLEGARLLKFSIPMHTAAERFERLENVLAQLTPNPEKG